MLLLAATSILPPLISVVIGVIGLGGLIFTALRYRRDDTSAIVTQQSAVFADLKSLNEELRTTAQMLRGERDTLQIEVHQLRGQVEALRVELREAHAQISGKMSKIERKLHGQSDQP